MRLGAIDVGTNSIHLLVADVGPDGGVVVVERAREQVELGAGGLVAHALQPDAVERGLATLAGFKRTCDTFGTIEVVCAATSAVREAENGADFVKTVRERTGIHIKAISGSEEARLIYLGTRDALDYSAGRVLLVDLGGGSTEVILCDAEEAQLLHSLPLGHIRLADRFVRNDPMTEAEVEAIKAEIRVWLQPLVSRLHPEDFATMVGTSGTIRSLARMATLVRGDHMPEHDHGLLLRRTELEDFNRTFARTPSAGWAEIPGMDMRRRRTLAVGALLVRQLMKATKKECLFTSERSLLFGLIVDWVLRHRPEIALSRTVADPRRRSVMAMMERYGAKVAHARHVARLSLAIFDGTTELHGLRVDDRRMLEFAALLHDIGHHISGEDHNRHGAYIVRHTRMHGFTAPEVSVLANLVRYHRGARPKTRHPEYQALSAEDRHRVRVMAGILRIADGLDRSHGQPVDDLTVHVADGEIEVRAFTRDAADLERWAADRRVQLLSSVLRRRVRVVLMERTPGPATPDL